ncbi:MAG: FlgD immunoglobulin-like domain containing protein [candidate division WOR-3 bacterium]
MRVTQPLVAIALLTTLGSAQVESLPAPELHGNSFELVSNSRYSVHSGFSSSLSRQVLGNVLWFMNQVPSYGSYRELYVADPNNVYLYNSVSHSLVVHLSGDHRYSNRSAFEVGIAVERDEEAGLAIQAGLLAATAFWDSTGGNVAHCPMQFATNYANSNWNPLHPIMMVNVYGQMRTNGLQHMVQAQSSDSTLPTPRVDGPDTFELVAQQLVPDSSSLSQNLTPDELSQILWAGYGVTPHQAVGKRGLTVPSAVAYYLLTRKIYVASEQGVARYHNRLPPGTDLTTSDHRLEYLDTLDSRPELRAGCPRLPSSAATYIVITVSDTAHNWHKIEAGFVAYQFLMQAKILGLRGFLTMPLSPSERDAIISSLGLPATDFPVIVFSVGRSQVGVRDRTGYELEGIRVSSTGKGGVRIEYTLPHGKLMRLEVYDRTGRTVRSWRVDRRTSSTGVVEWDGRNDEGVLLPVGEYLVRLTGAGGSAPGYSTRFLLTR